MRFLLFVQIASALAQNKAPLPILQPTITVVASVRDTTPRGALLPVHAGTSPNGKLIAYSTRTDLRLINATNGETRVIFDGDVHVFTWGPRGDALGLTHDDPSTGTRDVYVLHVDPSTGEPTGPAVKAARGDVNHGAFLSPDQSLIAFAEPVFDTRNRWTERAALVIAPANGAGGKRRLAEAQDLRIFRWSPDGRTVYYSGFPGETSKTIQLFSVPITGGRPTFVRDMTDDAWPRYRDPVTGVIVAAYAIPSNISVTDWSGNNPIAGVRFTRPRGVRIINTADGTTRDIIDLGGEVGVPDWFASGTRLAVLARSENGFALRTINADGTGERSFPLARAPWFRDVGSSNAHLQVSPDGKYAAFLGDTHETIELLDLTTAAQRTLVKVEGDGSAPYGLGLGQIIWNRDSESMLYVHGIWAPQHRAIREVSLTGAHKLVRALPDSLYSAHAIAFPSNTVQSPQHNSMLMLTSREQLAMVPISGGVARTLYRVTGDGVLYPGQMENPGSLSPDGKTFAIREMIGSLARQITFVSIADGSSRVTQLPFIPVPGLAWHEDGQRLLVMGREMPGWPTFIYSVPVDGSTPRVIAPVGSNRGESVIAVSPGGKLIAVTVAGTPTATFLRMNFDVSGVKR